MKKNCNLNQHREQRKRKFEQNPFSHYNALRFSIIISITLNIILFLGWVFNQKFTLRNATGLTHMFLPNVFMFYVLYLYNFWVVQKKWQRRFKHLATWLGSILIAGALNLIFLGILNLLQIDMQIPNKFFVITNLFKDLIVAIIVIFSTILVHTIYEKQKALFENEKLIAENIRIRYEALKSQVDPHFLFNSLNTLDGLISMDTAKAHDYVQNLSSVFRYTIGNKEIVKLEDELDFTKSYGDLMKIRYGDNLKIDYQINDMYLNYYILPVSLQLLVENAIKHNVVSGKYPLRIIIETTDNTCIRVSNIIQPKSNVEPGEGIGLMNLIERYSLLFQQHVSISSNQIFSVEVPLIKELKSGMTSL